jgi:hypothetical protein
MVPEVTTKGLPEPSRATPIASTAPRSAWSDAAKSVVSEMLLKAVWMTPSAAAAPLRRLLGSSRASRRTATPAAVRDAAAFSERARPTT